MPITTFNDLFEGTQYKVKEKMDVNEALLCKLEDYKIITHHQGSKLDVGLYLIYLVWLLLCYSHAVAVFSELSVPLFVRLSAKRVNCDKMKETSVYILIPYERLMHQVCDTKNGS